MPTRFPLQWPDGWKRTPKHLRRSLQGQVTFGDALNRLLKELRLMGIELDGSGKPKTTISSDMPLRQDGYPRADRGEPEDPGVAVYFKLDNRDLSFACDSFTTNRDNLRALALTLEAMRGIERWGASDLMDRMYRGFAALPQTATSPWRDTLGFGKDEKLTVDRIEERYRKLLFKRHPDYGGTDEDFRQLTEARSTAKKEVLSNV